MNCWLAAASQFGLPPGLLYAIAEVESGYRADAVAHARNGTVSIGIMQINSSWFPRLRQMGINESSLWKPCVNIQVGAWILSQEVARFGYTWEAIGAYYAGPYNGASRHWKLRHYRTYAQKVLKRWKVIESRRVDSLPSSTQGVKKADLWDGSGLTRNASGKAPKSQP